MFKNKDTPLITGGTGNIWECRVTAVLDTEINEIRVFSRDEKKQEDLRIALPILRLSFLLVTSAITTVSCLLCRMWIMFSMQRRSNRCLPANSFRWRRYAPMTWGQKT